MINKNLCTQLELKWSTREKRKKKCTENIINVTVKIKVKYEQYFWRCFVCIVFTSVMTHDVWQIFFLFIGIYLHINSRLWSFQKNGNLVSAIYLLPNTFYVIFHFKLLKVNLYFWAWVQYLFFTAFSLLRLEDRIFPNYDSMITYDWLAFGEFII